MPCHVRESLPEKHTEVKETDGRADETKYLDTKDLEPTDGAIESKHGEPFLLIEDATEMAVEDSFPQEVCPDIKVEETTELEPAIRPCVLG